METKTKSRLIFGTACLLIAAAGYAVPEAMVRKEAKRIDDADAKSAAAVAPVIDQQRARIAEAARADSMFTADLSRQTQAIAAAQALLKREGFRYTEFPVELLDQAQGLHVPVIRPDTLPEYKTAYVLELSPNVMIYGQDVGIWAKISARRPFNLQRLRCERTDDDTPTKAGTKPFVCRHHDAGTPKQAP